MKVWISVPDLARRMDKSYDTVIKLVRSGDLASSGLRL